MCMCLILNDFIKIVLYIIFFVKFVRNIKKLLKVFECSDFNFKMNILYLIRRMLMIMKRKMMMRVSFLVYRVVSILIIFLIIRCGVLLRKRKMFY